MRRVIPSILLLAWACWFGGAIALFVFVQSLFSIYPRSVSSTAVEAAPVLFNAFGKLQLILAAISLTAAFFWRVASRKVGLTAVFSLLAFSAMGAIALGAVVVPKMNALRAAGETTGRLWGKLHGISSVIYIGEAVLLLVAGVLILRAAWLDAKTVVAER